MRRTGPCCTTAGAAFGAGRRSLSPYWQEPCRSLVVWRSCPLPHDGPWSGIFGGRMSSPDIWPCCIRPGPRGCEKGRAVRRPDAAMRVSGRSEGSCHAFGHLPEGMRQQRIPSSRLVTDTQKDRRPCCGPPVFFHAFGGQDCHHADNGPAWDRGEEGMPTCRAFVAAVWEKSLGAGSTGGCH